MMHVSSRFTSGMMGAEMYSRSSDQASLALIDGGCDQKSVHSDQIFSSVFQLRSFSRVRCMGSVIKEGSLSFSSPDANVFTILRYEFARLKMYPASASKVLPLASSFMIVACSVNLEAIFCIFCMLVSASEE